MHNPSSCQLLYIDNCPFQSRRQIGVQPSDTALSQSVCCAFRFLRDHQLCWYINELDLRNPLPKRAATRSGVPATTAVASICYQVGTNVSFSAVLIQALLRLRYPPCCPFKTSKSIRFQERCERSHHTQWITDVPMDNNPQTEPPPGTTVTENLTLTLIITVIIQEGTYH